MSSFNLNRIHCPAVPPDIFPGRQDSCRGGSRGNRLPGLFIPALFPASYPGFQGPRPPLFPLFPFCSRGEGMKVKCFVPFVPPLYKGGTKEQITEELK